MRSLAVLGLLVALAGCSSPAPAPAAAPAPPPVCTVDDIGVAGDPGSKPTITVPDTCTPPAQLLSKDLVVGTGPEVVLGSTVQTHYDLVTWSDKRELDASWFRGETFPWRTWATPRSSTAGTRAWSACARAAADCW